MAAAGSIALAVLGLGLLGALFAHARRSPAEYRAQARTLALAAWLLLLAVGTARIVQAFLQETVCVELGKYQVCRLTTGHDLLDTVFALPLFSIAVALFALWVYVLLLDRFVARPPGAAESA